MEQTDWPGPTSPEPVEPAPPGEDQDWPGPTTPGDDGEATKAWPGPTSPDSDDTES